MRRFTVGALIAFTVGCLLITAATVVPGHIRTTAQGEATTDSWNTETVIYVGGCSSGGPILVDCRTQGHIRVSLTATISGAELTLNEKLTADPQLRFRASSHIRCRVNKFYDEDCPGQPERPPGQQFTTTVDATTKMALHDTTRTRAFLDLVYQIEVEGVGPLYGSRKYRGNVFIGTSWRWTCTPGPLPLQCQFTGRTS